MDAKETLDRKTDERLLSDFFENAAVGLHWVGPDSKILRANRAEVELLGYSKEECQNPSNPPSSLRLLPVPRGA